MCRSVNSVKRMLRLYIKTGRVNEARKILDEICRERPLTICYFEEILLTAERGNQASTIKLLLEYEPRYNAEFPDKNLSALWIAVLYRHEKAAELLVRSGSVDVNKRLGTTDHAIFHDEKFSLLHVLVRMRPCLWIEHFLSLILEHGADVHARDSEGITPMHFAVLRGRINLTELLLEKGADVNVTGRGRQGRTPLLVAVLIEEGVELVPLLLKHGADARAKDDNGNNALHTRANFLGQRVDIARALIENGAALDCRCFYSLQPIHYAAKYQGNELVKLYLDRGADANAQTRDGESPLTLAAAWNESMVLETLLKRGANVNLRTSKGRTALHEACKKSLEQSIRTLLSAGADVLIEDNNGNTPFALIANKDVENPSIRLMLQELALKKTRQPSIASKDERIIEHHPAMRDYYENCFKEIAKMKSMRLANRFGVYELLTASHLEIAKLMLNREFQANFKLCDLSVISKYDVEIIRRAYKRAEKHHHYRLKQQDLINEAVQYILPDVFVRKVLTYLFYDCCEE